MNNYKKYMDNILNYKQAYANAEKANDQTGMNTAAQKAAQYYDKLRSDSQGKTIADNLSNLDYEGAKKYADKYYNTVGKEQFRPYMYEQGKKYGFSKEQIDKATSYNPTTGEVSFGGKNLGLPSSEYDGVSYWTDTNKLDDAMKSFAENQPLSEDELYSQNQNNAYRRLNQQWDNIAADRKDYHGKTDEAWNYTKQDPFSTDEGKAIMSKYDLAALGAKGNALAASASTNGGNIDSNAAANAMRQQATLVQMGQSQVMDMYNNRISRMNDILSNLGVQIQAERNAENQNISNTIAAANNSFNNSETRKNNEYARQADIANITGETPDWMGNPYFNSDGTLKSGYDNIDFQSNINALTKQLANTKDAAERQKIQRRIDELNVARNAKIHDGSGRYSQYSATAIATPKRQTESARQSDAANALDWGKLATSERIATNQTAADERMNDAQLRNNLDVIRENTAGQIAVANATPTTASEKPRLTLEQTKQAIEDGKWNDVVAYCANYYGLVNPSGNGDGSNDPQSQKYAQNVEGLLDGKDISNGAKNYVRDVIVPLISDEKVVDLGNPDESGGLANNMVENSKKYKFSIADAKKICQAFDLDTLWLSQYDNNYWGSGFKKRNT